jgi:GntR family transcriptional regulator
MQAMPRSSMPVVLVNWSSDEPVYAQIARQIRAWIASGGLPAGTELPPVRMVASDLGVNLNTVARAYRILAEERFVCIRDRSGATVAPPAHAADAATVERLGEELAVVIARMRQAGVGIDELRRRVERELAGLESRGGK